MYHEGGLTEDERESRFGSPFRNSARRDRNELPVGPQYLSNIDGLPCEAFDYNLIMREFIPPADYGPNLSVPRRLDNTPTYAYTDNSAHFHLKQLLEAIEEVRLLFLYYCLLQIIN